MRILTVTLSLIFFALGMGVLHWLQKGFSQDFGTGFSIGLLIGTFTALLAAHLQKPAGER